MMLSCNLKYLRSQKAEMSAFLATRLLRCSIVARTKVIWQKVVSLGDDATWWIIVHFHSVDSSYTFFRGSLTPQIYLSLGIISFTQGVSASVPAKWHRSVKTVYAGCTYVTDGRHTDTMEKCCNRPNCLQQYTSLVPFSFSLLKVLSEKVSKKTWKGGGLSVSHSRCTKIWTSGRKVSLTTAKPTVYVWCCVTASHHSQTTNDGYSRKPCGGYYVAWSEYLNSLNTLSSFEFTGTALSSSHRAMPAISPAETNVCSYRLKLRLLRARFLADLVYYRLYTKSYSIRCTLITFVVCINRGVFRNVNWKKNAALDLANAFYD